MALIKRINQRDRYWIRNRQPYVEPTEEQKILAEKERIERRKRAREFRHNLGMILGTIQKYCPNSFD